MTSQIPFTAPPRTQNHLAAVSSVLALLALSLGVWRGLPLIGLAFSLVAIIVAIPAIITGHVARQRAQIHLIGGRALALWGLIIGYGTVAFSVLAPLVSTIIIIIGIVEFATAGATI